MSLNSDLTERFSSAFEAAGLDPALGDVVPAQRPEFGHFQCNGALPGAKAAGRNPRELATDIIEAIDRSDLIADLSVAGPGFINIILTDTAIADHLQRVADDERLGVPRKHPPANLIVDYGGPNVAKAMHVGHLRATIIGDALARLARFVGDNVTTDAHFGDWGTQMGMLLVAVEEEIPGLVYFDETVTDGYPEEAPVTLADLQRLYPAISRAVKDDESLMARVQAATFALQQGRPGYVALWRHFVAVSLASQRADFAALGVDFDLWYGESTVHGRVEPLIRRLLADGLARESEGAIVVDVEESADTAPMPPLLLTKTNGAYLYSSTDVATIDLRVDALDADMIWYVVDGRQALHFEQVFRTSRRAQIAPDSVQLEHIGFGTMNGPDGKPFQTRKGGVVRLADVIDLVRDHALQRLEENDLAVEYPADERLDIATKVGLAALKFGDLQNHRTTNYAFDLARFTEFSGRTGPYLQYGVVRARSLLDKATAAGLTPGAVLAPSVDAERNLMLRLLRLPEIVERAYELRAPNHLTEYAFELAVDLNRFYEECHVLNEPDADRQASWIALIAASAASLTLLLDLIGIDVPSRM